MSVTWSESSEHIRAVSAGLGVPLPKKTSLLRELRADLESLTERLIADGLTPAEARRRATAALVPDAATLRDLEAVHSTLYQRATSGLDEPRLRRLEQGLLALAMAAVAVPGGLILASTGIGRDPSPFFWPVIGLGVLLVGAAMTKAFELWVKGEHRRPRRGLDSMLFASLSVVGVAAIGVLIDTIVLFDQLERTPEAAGVLFFAALQREATLLAVALVIALGTGVFWLVAHQWIALTEDAHRRALAIELPSNSRS